MTLGIANEATFSIVEINKFKMVPHLSLKFRKGNDEAVKKYLANKYKDAKEVIKDLQTTLFNS
jgi:spindle assembly abnormal protein 6